MRTADVPAQPWLNGGGVTRELLARPGRDGWQVRVSVADVEADGPFSAFAGVSRWFAVLDGAGVVLTTDGVEHRCGPRDDAVAFAGDAATQARLVDGPTRDLNLMLRGVRGGLARVVPGATWRPGTRECGLYATTAGNCAEVARNDSFEAASSSVGVPASASASAFASASVSASVSASASTSASMPAHALRWWPDAPAAIAFDGTGWWLSADTEPAP
ncbi:MAG TPA: HutD family protein [Caldimonas sp.]|nr:HutD family protein [Caldimonas sp.]